MIKKRIKIKKKRIKKKKKIKIFKFKFKKNKKKKKERKKKDKKIGEKQDHLSHPLKAECQPNPFNTQNHGSSRSVIL